MQTYIQQPGVQAYGGSVMMPQTMQYAAAPQTVQYAAAPSAAVAYGGQVIDGGQVIADGGQVTSYVTQQAAPQYTMAAPQQISYGGSTIMQGATSYAAPMAQEMVVQQPGGGAYMIAGTDGVQQYVMPDAMERAAPQYSYVQQAAPQYTQQVMAAPQYTTMGLPSTSSMVAYPAQQQGQFSFYPAGQVPAMDFRQPAAAPPSPAKPAAPATRDVKVAKKKKKAGSCGMCCGPKKAPAKKK